jgi:CRISPR-associated endonuclease Cas2
MSTTRNSEFIYAYDISDDKERRIIERLLQGYGFRRQKSVFICRLTRADQVRLNQTIERLALKNRLCTHLSDCP